jgi:hypothetical protein
MCSLGRGVLHAILSHRNDVTSGYKTTGGKSPAATGMCVLWDGHCDHPLIARPGRPCLDCIQLVVNVLHVYEAEAPAASGDSLVCLSVGRSSSGRQPAIVFRAYTRQGLDSR